MAGSPSRILCYDIGGTGIKAAIVDPSGKLLTEVQRLPTPRINSGAELLKAMEPLATSAGAFQAISVGFPGVVRNGAILTSPTLKTEKLNGFKLAEALKKKFRVEARVANDAEVQGWPAIKGKGYEVVVTLGTGVGTAFYLEGKVGPHMEFSTHPLAHDETYNERLGNETLHALGKKKWRKAVLKGIETLRRLTLFDRLYLGGGNAKLLAELLPKEVSLISNDYGIRGGAWLWREGER